MIWIGSVFQLTASRRGWHKGSFFFWSLCLFQLTASRRGWQKRNSRGQSNSSFQLTASRRGWPMLTQHPRGTSIYFNSQPHEEADDVKLPVWLRTSISTHSLTKRLTLDLWAYSQYPQHFNSQPHEEADVLAPMWALTRTISTHSLTKRLTVLMVLSIIRLVFQLTASRRGWQNYRDDLFMEWGISTHSLTKRLTIGRYSVHSGLNISTHSLTKRLTCTVERLLRLIRIFQLTASRRGWHHL